MMRYFLRRLQEHKKRQKEIRAFIKQVTDIRRKKTSKAARRRPGVKGGKKSRDPASRGTKARDTAWGCRGQACLRG